MCLWIACGCLIGPPSETNQACISVCILCAHTTHSGAEHALYARTHSPPPSSTTAFHSIHTHTQKAAPPTLRRDQSAIQTRSGYTHHSPNTHHSVLHMSSVHQPIALQGEFHVSLYGHVHPELCISANVYGCAGTVVFKRHQRPKCKIKRKRGGNV